MPNRKNLTLLVILFAALHVCALARTSEPAAARAHGLSHARVPANAANDREQDGLSGPVRRVKTETAKITTKNARPVEGPRVLLETATYDIKGAKIDNAYFLAAGGTLTGKEVYKYDDKGNIVEMTMHNADGSLLSKEVYAYEFDSFGNWTKMITSVAVIEGGKMSFEPTEVTYRTFSYFLDEATLARMSQPAEPAAANGSAPAAPNGNTSANAPAAIVSSSSPSAQPAGSANNKANNAAAPTSKLISAPAPAAPKPDASKSEVGKSDAGRAAKVESKMASAPPAVASVDKLSVAAPSTVAVKSNASGAGPVVVSEGEAPAARPVARGPLKPVSGGILNGKAISLPQPFYPEMAKRARAAGLVTVEVIVDVTGRVISAKAVGGPAMLRAEAEKAAMQARFSPTLLSGQPVKVSGQIGYNFTLN